MEAKLIKSEQHYHQLNTTQAYLIIEPYTPCAYCITIPTVTAQWCQTTWKQQTEVQHFI